MLGFSRLVVLLSLVLLAVTPVPGKSQQQEGDVELQFTGSYFTTVGGEGSSSSGTVQGKASLFVSDRIEVGAFPSLGMSLNGSGDSNWNVGLGIFSSYSFLMENATTVPYLGIQFWRPSLEEDYNFLGLNAGMKFFMSPQVAFTVGANYLTESSDPEQGVVLIQTGLSFLLRR